MTHPANNSEHTHHARKPYSTDAKHQPQDADTQPKSIPSKAEKDAPKQTEASHKDTEQAHDAQTKAVNHPDYSQHPATTEMPSHLGAKTHAPYPEKPDVQHVHEQLSDATPTGYAPHDTNVDLDQAQLDSIKPQKPGEDVEVTNARNEDKQRVENDKKDPTAHPHDWIDENLAKHHAAKSKK